MKRATAFAKGEHPRGIVLGHGDISGIIFWWRLESSPYVASQRYSFGSRCD